MTTYSEIQLIIMAAIFVIVLTVAYKSLSQMFDFGGSTILVLAVCVAVLSIIGLSEVFTSFETNTGNTENPDFSFKLDVILLPYIALPLAILATVIAGFIARILQACKKRSERRYRPGKNDKPKLGKSIGDYS